MSSPTPPSAPAPDAADVADVVERLRALFLDELHLELPSADTDLLATGLLDSLAFVELMLQLESRFGVVVRLDEIDLEQFRTVRSIARTVAASGRADAPRAGSPPLSGTRLDDGATDHRAAGGEEAA